MSYCNRCGAEVKWFKRKRGWVPYEPRVPGTPRSTSPTIHRCGKPKGQLVVPGGHTGQKVPECPNPCGLPPWETCGCSFPEVRP